MTVSSDRWLIWLYARIGLATSATAELVILLLAARGTIDHGQCVNALLVAAGPVLLSIFSLDYWRTSARTVYVSDGVRLRVVRRSKVVFDEPVERIRCLRLGPKLGPRELLFSPPYPDLPRLCIQLVDDPYDEVKTIPCALWGDAAHQVAVALAAACGGTTEAIE
ncbi:hypothetical protein [Nocardioides montaniterrae]